MSNVVPYAVVILIVVAIATGVIIVFARTIRLLGRVLIGGGGGGPVARVPRPMTTGSDPQVRCRNPGCRTASPPHARFCRRCGATLAPPRRWVDRPQPFAQAQPTRQW